MVFCLAPVCASHGNISSTAVAASHAFSSGLPSIVIRRGGPVDFVARQRRLRQQAGPSQQRHRKIRMTPSFPIEAAPRIQPCYHPASLPRYSVCWKNGKLMCKLSWLFVALMAAVLAAADSTPLPLWPGTPPGDKGGLGPEKDTTKPTDGLVAGKPVIRLGMVSNPTMTLYSAPAAHQHRRHGRGLSRRRIQHPRAWTWRARRSASG